MPLCYYRFTVDTVALGVYGYYEIIVLTDDHILCSNSYRG